MNVLLGDPCSRKTMSHRKGTASNTLESGHRTDVDSITSSARVSSKGGARSRHQPFFPDGQKCSENHRAKE